MRPVTLAPGPSRWRLPLPASAKSAAKSASSSAPGWANFDSASGCWAFGSRGARGSLRCPGRESCRCLRSWRAESASGLAGAGRLGRPGRGGLFARRSGGPVGLRRRGREHLGAPRSPGLGRLILRTTTGHLRSSTRLPPRWPLRCSPGSLLCCGAGGGGCEAPAMISSNEGCAGVCGLGGGGFAGGALGAGAGLGASTAAMMSSKLGCTLLLRLAPALCSEETAGDAPYLGLGGVVH